jgi:muramidase (phage lysozyme)
VIAGNFQEAVRKCAREWASLPGSPYGQPMRTLAQALETYASYGGDISEDTTA